jgi:sirohydrochlorin ferrochelatase
LLFAHGTSDGGGGATARRLAAELLDMGGFAGVAVAFSRQPPHPAEALAAMAAHAAAGASGCAHVLVAPLLTCEGRLMRDTLPRLLASAPEFPQRTVLAPLGQNPAMAGLASGLAEQAVAAAGLDPRQVAVLVAGHGSSVDPASARATRRLAADIAGRGVFAQVSAIFLAEAPFATHWRRVAPGRPVVVVPFFLSGGHHEEEDLSACLGLGHGKQAAADGQPVWMTPPLGHHPALAGLIARQAEDWSSEDWSSEDWSATRRDE